jgi:hypothetical protein
MPRRTTVRVLFGMAVAATSLSLAGAALAAPAQPARTGQFKTWSAAQRAAGFKLVKPGETDGLIRAGRINVT